MLKVLARHTLTAPYRLNYFILCRPEKDKFSIAWQPLLPILESEAETREEEEGGQLYRSINVHIPECHVTQVVEQLNVL